jgi:putative FmdB family regulatory protein
MPTYQYACTSCGEQLERVQKFSDEPLSECPACGGRLRKVFSAVGVVFKGSGFYKTDSRSSGSKKKDEKTESTRKSDDLPASTAGEKSSSPDKSGSDKSGSDKSSPNTSSPNTSSGDKPSTSSSASGQVA